MTVRARFAFFATTAASMLLLGGCASTNVDAQFADPQFAGTSLRGARILVACDAYDISVKRICEEQMAAELTARGATAVTSAETQGTPAAADPPAQAGKTADAKAVLVVKVSQADSRVSPGFSVGLGGYGIGGGSVRGGVGVSVPIGGGQLTMGHAASGSLTDTASGRVIWTAKASTPPSNDLNDQMGELAKAMVGAAEKAGLF